MVDQVRPRPAWPSGRSPCGAFRGARPESLGQPAPDSRWTVDRVAIVRLAIELIRLGDRCIAARLGRLRPGAAGWRRRWPRAARLGCHRGAGIGARPRRSECRRPGGSGPAVAAQLPDEWSAEKRRRVGSPIRTGLWAGGDRRRTAQRAGDSVRPTRSPASGYRVRSGRSRAGAARSAGAPGWGPRCSTATLSPRTPRIRWLWPRSQCWSCSPGAGRSSSRAARRSGHRSGSAVSPRVGVTGTILVAAFIALAYGVLRNLA